MVMRATVLTDFIFDYGDREIRLFVWRVLQYRGQAASKEAQALRFVRPSELPTVRTLAANARIIPYLFQPGVNSDDAAPLSGC